MPRPFRARRSVLAVPGSNPRMLDKARGLPADQVLLDLEDGVAEGAKPAARGTVVEALRGGDWGARTLSVRVNALSTRHTYRDVVEVVEGAGRRLDVVVLPKVQSAAHVVWLDLMLTQIEATMRFEPGRIGIEAQVEDPRGLLDVEAIAAASPRLEALVFGPGDWAAATGMRSVVVGEQPPGYDGGDAFAYPLMRLLVAARAHGLQVVDGPYQRFEDVDGLRRKAARAAALGFDGTWVVHPSQLPVANEAFTPTQAEHDRAQDVLAAVAAAAGSGTGAVRLGGEVVDEASAAMARAVVQRGRAGGLVRSEI